MCVYAIHTRLQNNSYHLFHSLSHGAILQQLVQTYLAISVNTLVRIVGGSPHSLPSGSSSGSSAPNIEFRSNKDLTKQHHKASLICVKVCLFTFKNYRAEKRRVYTQPKCKYCFALTLRMFMKLFFYQNRNNVPYIDLFEYF